MSCDVVWEDSIIFSGTSYLIDFLAQQVLKENKTNCFVFLKKRSLEKLFCYSYEDKLICFLNNKISLLIGNLSSYLLKLQFADFGLLAWYRTVQNQLFLGFKYLKKAGAFGALPLDPTRGITLPSPIQCPMGPATLGMLIRCLLSNDLLN